MEFRDNNSILYEIDAYDLAFDDVEEASLLLGDYKNRVPLKDFDGPQTISAAKHLVCARCGEIEGYIAKEREIGFKYGSRYSSRDLIPSFEILD